MMRSGSKSIVRLCLVGAALSTVIYSSLSHAQLVQNITIGNPKALALGNAVTADPPGIDSIHFNPAGLAKIRGRQSQVKLLAAHITYDAKIGARHLDINADPDSNAPTLSESYQNIAGEPYPDDPIENSKSYTSDPILMLPGSGMTSTPVLLVPFGGFAIQDPDHNYVFGSAVYSPQAIGYERDADDPGSFQGQRLAITRITYLSPSVGFKIGEHFYVGGSVGLSWQGFGIETKIRAPEPTIAFLKQFTEQLNDAGIDQLKSIGPYDTVGTVTVEMEDNLSLSYNLGFIWEPNHWFALGMVYQSESKSDLKGDYKMEYTDEWMAMTESLEPFGAALALLNGGFPINAQKEEEGKVEMEYTVPAHFSIGTSTKLFPDLKVNVDLKYTDYNEWDYLDLQFDKGIDFLTISDLIYSIPQSRGDGDNANPDLMRIKRDYNSVWSWAFGVEYDVNDYFTLRFGYEPRKSVVPDNRVDILAPIAGADLYSFGFEYFLDQYSQVQFGFGWLHSEFDAPAGSSESANSVQPGHVVYNPYAYLDIESETNAYIFALSYDSKF